MAKTRGLVGDDMDWDALDLSFDRGKDKAIILSENLTRDELYELFSRFKKEQIKMRVKRLINNVLRNPLIIPRVLLIAFKVKLLHRA